jgi:hypothetical protein
MNLAELNRRVTSAIFRAERLAEGSWEAQEAYREVSLLEEEIAGLVGPSEVEGAIAREGAFRAAIAAGEHLRALYLATRYLEEDAAPARSGASRSRGPAGAWSSAARAR